MALPGLLFSTIAGTRLRRTGQHLRAQTLLLLVLFVALALAVGFGIAAATVAIAARIGVTGALLVMAAIALFAAAVAGLLLASESRRHRQRVAERAQTEGLAQAALLSFLPRALRPSGRGAGLGLLLLGVLLLARRSKDD